MMIMHTRLALVVGTLILMMLGWPGLAAESVQSEDAYAGRSEDGRKKAVAQHGGSAGTEAAVEAALRWLVRHQEKDGSWDPVKYEAESGSNVRYRVGCTGLALLAFVGAGYTEKSSQFAEVVKNAEQWLMRQQKPSGVVAEVEKGGSQKAVGYNHAIAALALTEAYGLTKNPQLADVANRALFYSTRVHQNPGGGWRYDAKTSEDTSVTSWFVIQLKSAKQAKLAVDEAAFAGARAFLDKQIDKDGRTAYNIAEKAPSPAMTAAGMVCRQLMGAPHTDPLLVKGADYLLKYAPSWKQGQQEQIDAGDSGFYYWHYGTLAMFQVGGDKWTKWNEPLKKTLVPNQCKGGPMDGSVNDKDGSWDPQSWIDKYGGRVFTTACGALTLEVYYRYLPMYSK